DDIVIPGLGGPISAVVATAIYRNNVLEGFSEGLKNIYGAIFLLIGENCFREIAYAYCRTIPSLSGDRNAYGDRGGVGLSAHGALATVPAPRHGGNPGYGYPWQ
ncbi:HvfC/BufC family peptide modification chaperone, partial [Acidithiobacillus ferrooxidans]|uniref:HvfC/BufC family peptide modification chaperone n=1 Tax=Acidithiobacillus ferrooxidans TaxID=920 RepID=UPI001EF2938F